MEEDFSKYNGTGTVLRKTQLRIVDILVEVDKICRRHNIQYWIDYGTLLGAVRHGGFIPWDDDVDISMLREDYLKLIQILPAELPEWLTFQNDDNEPYYIYKFGKVRDRYSYLHDPLANPKMKEHGVYVDIFPVEKMFSKRFKIMIENIYGKSFRWKRKSYISKWKYMVAVILLPFGSVLVAFSRCLFKFKPSCKLYIASGIPFFYEAEFNEKEIFPCKPIIFEGKEFMGPANPHEYLKNIYGDYMKLPAEKDRIMTHAEQIDFY